MNEERIISKETEGVRCGHCGERSKVGEVWLISERDWIGDKPICYGHKKCVEKAIRQALNAGENMGEEEVIELLACPFCGGEAAIGTVKYPEDSDVAKLNKRNIGYYVNCVSCSANMLHDIGYATQEQAARKWNARAEEERLREKMKKVWRCPCGGEFEGEGYYQYPAPTVSFRCKKCKTELIIPQKIWYEAIGLSEQYEQALSEKG